MKKNSFKVLLFEDEIGTNADLTKTLKSEGYDVLSTFSYEETLEAVLKGYQPDLALLDIKQNETLKFDARPEAGFELAFELKKIKKSLPIIFFSSYNEFKERALEYAPVGFFEKGKTDIDFDTRKNEVLKEINKVFEKERKEQTLNYYFKDAWKGKLGFKEKENSKTKIKVLDIKKITTIISKNNNNKEEFTLGEQNPNKILFGELKKILLDELNPSSNKKTYFHILKYQGDYFKHKVDLHHFLKESDQADIKDIPQMKKERSSHQEKILTRLSKSAFDRQVRNLIKTGVQDEARIETDELNQFKLDEGIRLFFEIELLQKVQKITLFKMVHRQYLQTWKIGGDVEEVNNVSLSSFIEQLDVHSVVHQLDIPFIHVSKGTIINLDFVAAFDEDYVYMDDDTGKLKEYEINSSGYNRLCLYFPTLRT